MCSVRPLGGLCPAIIGLAGIAGPSRAFTAYVSNEKGNSVSVDDTATMETTATIKTGERPRGIAVNPK